MYTTGAAIGGWRLVGGWRLSDRGRVDRRLAGGWLVGDGIQGLGAGVYRYAAASTARSGQRGQEAGR